MTPARLLAEVAAAGLSVDLDSDGGLLVRPGRGATETVVAALRANKPAIAEYLARRERMMQHAAFELQQSPERQRVAKIEPNDDGGHIVAIAVRMADGGTATATLTVPQSDTFELMAAFARACEAPLH